MVAYNSRLDSSRHPGGERGIDPEMKMSGCLTREMNRWVRSSFEGTAERRRGEGSTKAGSRKTWRNSTLYVTRTQKFNSQFKQLLAFDNLRRSRTAVEI